MIQKLLREKGVIKCYKDSGKRQLSPGGGKSRKVSFEEVEFSWSEGGRGRKEEEV